MQRGREEMEGGTPGRRPSNDQMVKSGCKTEARGENSPGAGEHVELWLTYGVGMAAGGECGTSTKTSNACQGGGIALIKVCAHSFSPSAFQHTHARARAHRQPTDQRHKKGSVLTFECLVSREACTCFAQAALTAADAGWP